MFYIEHPPGSSDLEHYMQIPFNRSYLYGHVCGEVKLINLVHLLKRQKSMPLM